jgi:hypothetical protein
MAVAVLPLLAFKRLPDRAGAPAATVLTIPGQEAAALAIHDRSADRTVAGHAIAPVRIANTANFLVSARCQFSRFGPVFKRFFGFALVAFFATKLL